MQEVYKKDGTLINLVDDLDVHAKVLDFNSIGAKINIVLKFYEGIDKATVFIFGNSNKYPFVTIIQVNKNDTNGEVINITGNISINKITNTENEKTIQINSDIYGSCAVFATLPILKLFASN